MASQPPRRAPSVRLVEPEDVVDEPRDAMTTSYLLDGHVFVRDNVAIMPNGVAMKDSSRTFVVDPESLSYGPILGRGASSIVQQGIHLPTNTPLALKVINIYDKTKRVQLTREIQALYDADCDCLVSFFGAFYKDGAITIALEYMDQGSLTTIVQNKGPMPEQIVAAMAFQVLWALAYLRVEKRLHRDLKPSNILVNSQGQVKLSDFGISSELQHSLGMAATFTGTCRYMAPERIAHKPYTFPSDIWSLGVVLVECATGKYPFPECSTYIEMAEAIVESAMPSIPASKGFSLEGTQFVASCLQKNPEERLPADVLLGSPWFPLHGVRSIESAVEVMAAWLAAPVTLSPSVSPAALAGFGSGARHISTGTDLNLSAAAKAALDSMDDAAMEDRGLPTHRRSASGQKGSSMDLI